MRLDVWVRGVFAVTTCAALAACASSGPEVQDAAARPLPEAAAARSAATAPGASRDAAALRTALLRRMDAAIEERAAREHLEARLLLDEIVPVPYLGVDADPDAAAGGMRITKVYALTSAEEIGLRAGDVVVAVDGAPVPDGAAFGGALRRHAVGDDVHVAWLRDGARSERTARLGHRPEEDEDEAEQFPYLNAPDAPPPPAQRLAFDADQASATPAGLAFELGGHGRPPRFVVHDEAGARFVRQEDGDPTGIRFPIALVSDFAAPDALVRVRFRCVAGRQDRAAGVVLRFRDRWNYIVARVNASEGDLRIFRVAHGLRTTLPGGRALVDVADDGWHTLTLRAEGARLTAAVDDRVAVTAWDTYVRGGRAGVWTKSDSVTDFDDLEVAPLLAGAGD